MACSSSPVTAAASASVPICGFVSSTATSSASNSPPFGLDRSLAVIVQYSSGTNAWISRSRSQISRTATDCTRPALSPLRTLRHSSGLSL